MPDRVREAVFAGLGDYFGTCGSLPPLHVADGFAGSGSMGLEALSRGAASCDFFERNRLAISVLKANMTALHAEDRGTIIMGDAWSRLLERQAKLRYALILLDPPYCDTRDSSPGGRIRTFLRSLDTRASRPLVVVHHPAGEQFDGAGDDGWRIDHHRVYGSGATTWFA